MVQFEVTVNKKQRLVYFPKALVASLGHNLTVVPDTCSAVVFSSDSDIDQVIESIHLIERHLQISKGRKPPK